MKGKRGSLFAEIKEGVEALGSAREGKVTLRTHKATAKPALKVGKRDLVKLREQLNLSRAVFARYLRTNARTLENWEQGRAKPNAQASLLIKLVEKYPDTVERLNSI